MRYSTTWLLNQLTQQEPVKYLLFWGHQPAQDGRITKACFSQWWVAEFVVEGCTYRSAEHWMMAEKARLFLDESTRQRILAAPSPAEAKKLGREVQGFEAGLWEANKYQIVKAGNRHKFSQHPALAEFLGSTTGRVLVEASPVDPVWGIGLAADHPDAENPAAWRGGNLLGFALMEVRDELTQSL